MSDHFSGCSLGADIHPNVVETCDRAWKFCQTSGVIAGICFFIVLVLPYPFLKTHQHREAQYQQRPGPHYPHEDAVLVEVVLPREVLPAIPEARVDELA